MTHSAWYCDECLRRMDMVRYEEAEARTGACLCCKERGPLFDLKSCEKGWLTGWPVRDGSISHVRQKNAMLRAKLDSIGS